jgi:hypothetical protein
MENFFLRDAHYVISIPMVAKLANFKDALKKSRRDGYNDRLYFEIDDWVENMIDLPETVEKELPLLTTLAEYEPNYTRDREVLNVTDLEVSKPQLLLNVPYPLTKQTISPIQNTYLELKGIGPYAITTSFKHPDLRVGILVHNAPEAPMYYVQVYSSAPDPPIVDNNPYLLAKVFLDKKTIVSRDRTSQYNIKGNILALIPKEQEIIESIVLLDGAHVYISPDVQDMLCLSSSGDGVIPSYPDDSEIFERYSTLTSKPLYYLTASDAKASEFEGYLYANADVKGEIIISQSEMPNKTPLGYISNRGSELPVRLPPLGIFIQRDTTTNIINIYKRCTGSMSAQALAKASVNNVDELYKAGLSLKSYFIPEDSVGRVIL